MKENSLNPGDKVGQWNVKRHIANGCIYAVTREDDPATYALKLREQRNQGRFEKEIEVLERLNKPGGHPAFQKLIDYSLSDLWMSLSPIVEPGWRAGYLGGGDKEILEKIDLRLFLEELIGGFRYALECGVYLRSGDTAIYVRPDGGPFFIDIEHAALTGEHPQFLNDKAVVLGLLGGRNYPPLQKILMAKGLLELI